MQQFFCDRKKTQGYILYLLTFLSMYLILIDFFSRARVTSEFLIKREIFYNLSSFLESELRIHTIYVIMVENHGAI